MKIDPTGPVHQARLRRRDPSKGAGAGGFASRLAEGTDSAAGAGTGAPVQTVGNLLALQEAPDPTDGRSRGLAQGEEILDRLDRIRHDLLTGGISRENLHRLAGAARAQRATIRDPELLDILDQIELRAEVELAKYGG